MKNIAVPGHAHAAEMLKTQKEAGNKPEIGPIASSFVIPQSQHVAVSGKSRRGRPVLKAVCICGLQQGLEFGVIKRKDTGASSSVLWRQWTQTRVMILNVVVAK